MRNQMRPKSLNVVLKIVDAMEDSIEGIQTVAASLAAITHRKAGKAQTRAVRERDKSDKPEAAHSLIATVGRVVLERQLIKETAKPPAKIRLHVLQPVKSQIRLTIKNAELSRKAKRALRAKTAWRSQSVFLRFAYVRRYPLYLLPGNSARRSLVVWGLPC